MLNMPISNYLILILTIISVNFYESHSSPQMNSFKLPSRLFSDSAPIKMFHFQRLSP